MKRTILFILIIALIAAMLPGTALAAKKSISLGGKVGLMYEDMAVTLKPKLKGITKSQLSWSSSAEGVAMVSGGTISSVKPGLAVITASAGKVSASCGVVVLPREISISAGKTASLPCASVEKYAVEHKNIAKISKDGVITGVSAGSTRIAVRYGKQTLYIKVNVSGNGGNGMEQSKAAYLGCADETDQIVLVEFQSGSQAKLSIHEKQDGAWKQLYSCSADVGKNGIGKTREGDHKTPTGTYNLTKPFGIKADPGANMSYTKVTEHHYWCGTSGSKYYNQMIDTRKVDRACTSSDEYLLGYGSVYNYCMFIDYNASGVAGKGSCIFLHCKGSNRYTAGCIAVEEAVMKKIIQWAKPGAKIVIC